MLMSCASMEIRTGSFHVFVQVVVIILSGSTFEIFLRNIQRVSKIVSVVLSGFQLSRAASKQVISLSGFRLNRSFDSEFFSKEKR